MPLENPVPLRSLFELAVAHQAIRLYRGEEGQVLVTEGKEDPNLLFVLRGEVDALLGERRLHTFEAGAMLGADRVFTNEREARLTLRCAASTLMLEVHADAYAKLVEEHNPTAWALERAALNTQVRLVRELDAQIAKMVTGSARELPSDNTSLLSRLFPRGLSRPNDEALAGQLHANPLFAGVKFAHLERLAEHLRAETLPDGGRLSTEGEAPSRAYLLLEGRATTLLEGTSGRFATIGKLDAPGFVGMVSAIDGLPHSATVVADGVVEAVWIDHATCRALISGEEPYASALRRAMLRALTALTGQARHTYLQVEEDLRAAVRNNLAQDS